LVFNAPHGKGESVLDQCLKVFMCGILDPKSPESSLKVNDKKLVFNAPHGKEIGF
jgi:hypothetical protein